MVWVFLLPISETKKKNHIRSNMKAQRDQLWEKERQSTKKNKMSVVSQSILITSSLAGQFA